MEGNLVIVESPAKARTIQKFLGNDFVVKSSMGHIRDLHDNSLSIDVEHGFKPEYVVPDDKKKIVADLKKAAKAAATVWLASDEDREGEAISWHLFDTLGLKKENTRRIVFHEITKTAIMNAIESPRDIDMNLVDAQQARRILDRLVGFELSPVLWRKIQPKLSAGRVQSVALRLVVDREREIMAFRKEQYYKVEAMFHPEGNRMRRRLFPRVGKYRFLEQGSVAPQNREQFVHPILPLQKLFPATNRKAAALLHRQDMRNHIRYIRRIGQQQDDLKMLQFRHPT